ncbi:hypothetical protein AMAG_06758 [Allomyces macrogynus ATCC 38327]|uniref:Thioredoxin domain-containing protein n=1 Tax=Allomyces macrogynus (strain ATCC 38327) TaxID=578462 RepID=A0A0L0SET8_ALLM3|nr:hypothetical protein AMAG_06758 [Allomyces macrogynus ATCC 38327]|eukprot:KNE60996.1 hypothetical protein AMAG_06758 [Allomyces macrogynus ATCC 38327]
MCCPASKHPAKMGTANSNSPNPWAPVPSSEMLASSAGSLNQLMSDGKPAPVDAVDEPALRDFAGRLVDPKGWQTVKVNFERHCRLCAEVERKYLFLVFYDPQSIACFQRHDNMTKHEGLSAFLAANFVRVMVPNADPFCQLYMNELFPTNTFPMAAIHDPVTMRRVALFANVDRKLLKEECTKRSLSFLSNPDDLLGELVTIVGGLPPLPEPDHELLLRFGLPVPAKPEEVEMKEVTKPSEAESPWYDHDKKLDTDQFPSSLIATVPTLDEAITLAQVTGRYILISVHADSSSRASRAVNRDLWYHYPIMHTLHTKYVVVRLDAEVDPTAKRILHTPVTSSQPQGNAHSAAPYLEVMHPFGSLRISIFGTDPTTGKLWGKVRGDAVEAQLLDLVIQHPLAALGSAQAEGIPQQIVSGETHGRLVGPASIAPPKRSVKSGHWSASPWKSRPVSWWKALTRNL